MPNFLLLSGSLPYSSVRGYIKNYVVVVNRSQCIELKYMYNTTYCMASFRQTFDRKWTLC